MTKAEMLERIDADELAEWGEEYKLMPFGEDWKQTARICGVVADAMGLKKKDGGAFQEADFYPIVIKQFAQRESDESIARKLASVAEHNRKQAKKPTKKKN